MRRTTEGVKATDVAQLCHRIRAAGAPGGKARPKLLAEYQRIAGELGATAVEISTGRDLERAAAKLLRSVATRERAQHAHRRGRV
ncbi:MAG: hypothetical protein OEM67_08570 [Thermoleophilia bacterium]|nr:hypothetical protein [Thermoleophilia bacterium]